MHNRPVIVACAAVLLSQLAFAQPAEPAQPSPAPAEPAPAEASYRLSVGAAHQFDTGLEAANGAGVDDGDFSLTRYGVGLTAHYPIKNTDWLIDHSLVYEYDDYQFSGDAAFVRNTSTGRHFVITDEPWEDTQLINYSLRGTYLINRDWSTFGGVTIGTAYETGADLSDSFSYGLTGGVRQQLNKDLGLGLGIIAIHGIDDDYTLFPMLLIDWTINEHLSVRNGRPQPGLRGTTGAEIVWTISSEWELSAGWAYDRREFRLNDDGIAPDGVGRNSSYPTYVRLNYLPTEKLSLSAMAGYILGGEMRLKDEHHTLGEIDYESAPFVALGLSYRF